jgi:hypothetical protein
MKEKRRKVWIDRLQTYLSLRIALYFVLYQVAVWALVAMELKLSDFAGSVGGVTPYTSLITWAGILLLGFVFIFDAVRWTHRFVGPLYRIRQTLRAVTVGKEVDLVHLRQGDYFEDMRDEVNELLKVLEQRGAVILKGGAAKPEPSQPVPA